MAEVVTARESFFVDLDGRPVMVTAGEPWAGDDPVVKGREHLFQELKVKRSVPANPQVGPGGRTADEDPDEETADAAPGTRRNTTAGLKDVSTPGDSTGHAGEIVGEKDKPVSTPRTAKPRSGR